MSSITITPTLSVAENGSNSVMSLATTGGAGCTFTLEYVQDQFFGEASNILYLNYEFENPTNVCVPKSICLHRVNIYQADRDGFATGPDGAYDETQTYLEYIIDNNNDYFIAASFASLGIAGSSRISKAVIRLRLVSGSVDDTVIPYVQTSFPSDASDIGAQGGLSVSATKQSILAVDVTTGMQNLLIAVGDSGTLNDACFVMKISPSGTSMSAVQFGSSRNATQELRPTLSVRVT